MDKKRKGASTAQKVGGGIGIAVIVILVIFAVAYASPRRASVKNY